MGCVAKQQTRSLHVEISFFAYSEQCPHRDFLSRQLLTAPARRTQSPVTEGDLVSIATAIVLSSRLLRGKAAAGCSSPKRRSSSEKQLFLTSETMVLSPYDNNHRQRSFQSRNRSDSAVHYCGSGSRDCRIPWRCRTAAEN